MSIDWRELKAIQLSLKTLASAVRFDSGSCLLGQIGSISYLRRKVGPNLTLILLTRDSPVDRELSVYAASSVFGGEKERGGRFP